MTQPVPVEPTLEAIRATRVRLGERVLTTPVRLWQDDALSRAVGPETRVFLKEELFQNTGSFKPRGALAVMQDLSPQESVRGVTAVSAGNHAMLGLELLEQAEGLDAVIVPIGGGGLCAGVASAVKLASPRTLVFGVEPEGADSMHRQVAAGAAPASRPSVDQGSPGSRSSGSASGAGSAHLH